MQFEIPKEKNPGKIAEINERLAQLKHMKAMLEKTLSCECATLEDCGGKLNV